MGVNISIDNLKNLYAASQAFGTKVDAIIERLQSNINKISNPAFTDGMQGGQGDEAVKALATGRIALEALLESVKLAREFIDRKIDGAMKMSQDTNGFERLAAQQRRNAENAKLDRK